ncbi:DDE_3 domain-containing protein [Trichonephila clavipes]|nr:DDE_3 domain-containing protein [Trichonephila clavipes]
MIFYVIELLDDFNVDVPSWKYPRNLESPRVSSPGFGNDSKMMVMFSLQLDSRRTLIWRAPGTHYHQENTIERHRYECNDDRPHLSGCHSGTTCTLVSGRHGCFFFMDDNARPHHANIVDECLQLKDITRMDWPAFSPDLDPIEHEWDMLG